MIGYRDWLRWKETRMESFLPTYHLQSGACLGLRYHQPSVWDGSLEFPMEKILATAVLSPSWLAHLQEHKRRLCLSSYVWMVQWFNQSSQRLWPSCNTCLRHSRQCLTSVYPQHHFIADYCGEKVNYTLCFAVIDYNNSNIYIALSKALFLLQNKNED